MELFYTSSFNEDNCYLDREESHHCIKVLRLREGGAIFVTNGKGDLFRAKITKADSAGCELGILEKHPQWKKRDYSVDIGISPPKNASRFENFIEKATEIGIDTITPLLCRHSERKTIKHARLEKIITAAMKQSLKAYRPQLMEMTKFTDAVKKKFDGQKFIATGAEQGETDLGSLYRAGENAFILIGPEGGFSEEEVNVAISNGYSPAALGKYRLRTETAGIVSTHTVHLLNNCKQDNLQL